MTTTPSRAANPGRKEIKMKMIFVVFVQEQNGKFCAIADTIRTGENLTAYIQRYKTNICHLCESRKQAEEIAVAWNKAYKANGTNLL